MKNNPLKTGTIAIDSKGVGTVTPKMVKKRAKGIAEMNDSSGNDATRANTSEARRELSGEGDTDPKEEFLESIAEADRWNLPAGSAGKKVIPTGNEDEDNEGRSDNERLVEEGVADAENDQMVQASKREKKKR